METEARIRYELATIIRIWSGIASVVVTAPPITGIVETWDATRNGYGKIDACVKRIPAREISAAGMVTFRSFLTKRLENARTGSVHVVASQTLVITPGGSRM